MVILCPLCCNETFESAAALKNHLINIIENLLCTICGKKFLNVRSLAEHLISDCKISKSNDENDEEEDDKSLLKALLKKGSVEESTKLNQKENTNKKADMGSSDLYDCSTCKIKFENLEKHLNDFHMGQEVVIDDGSNSAEEEAEFLSSKEGGSNMYQTLKEDECTDKAGRVYTRKVVQIEKFWDDSKVDPKIKMEPLVQYFTINDGIAIKISDDQLGSEAKTQSDNILQVFQCRMCSIYFTKQKQFEKHNCHRANIQCLYCDASFPHKRALNAHMRIHSENKTKPAPASKQTLWVCEFCSTPFNSFKSMKLHMRMHDPVKTKEVEAPVSYGIFGEVSAKEGTKERVMFTCEICNNDYDEEYREVHMQSHSKEENFNCNICNRKFFTATNLEMHMRIHMNGKSHNCIQCKLEFNDFKELEDHIKSHDVERPYECKFCKRRFIRPHEKVKHERIHTGEKPHICGVCGKAFRVSYCLTLHMRTHSGSRPYQCNECGKRFKAHSVYNHHLLIHSNVRKYKCTYCPKMFKTAVQLAGHKNTHTKPFTCTVCNRPFASLYAVRSHMETHKTENNLKYNCYYCGASYARAFALRDHIKGFHENEVWDEDDFENSNAGTSIGNEDGTVVESELILNEGLNETDVNMEIETVEANVEAN